MTTHGLCPSIDEGGKRTSKRKTDKMGAVKEIEYWRIGKGASFEDRDMKEGFSEEKFELREHNELALRRE